MAKKKILIVESNEELRELYRARLELDGYETKWVDSGEKALAAAVDFAPDLVLLNIAMPKMNGLDILGMLRDTQETKGVKAVLLTTLWKIEEEKRATELGADYLVIVEDSLDELMECIRARLQRQS